MSSAFSGLAAAMGEGMRQGVESHFRKISSDGGVHGQTVRLIALDDGYEPERTAPNVRRLIEEEKVIALIGNGGTPTAVVTVPIVQQMRTLLFGAYTGASLLRKKPPERYVVNYRASYREETAAMVTGLLNRGIKPEEIAFFTQNDSFGDDGYRGGIETLQAMGFSAAEKLPHGRYTRNTINVEEGLSTILAGKVDPKAIILVGSYKPCAAFIRLARRDLPNTLFLNVSFVGSEPLARELGAEAEGVIVTQVVPPLDSDLPLLHEFRQVMKDMGMNSSLIALEGYLVARLFTLGLTKAGPDPTHESLVDALENLGTVDLGLDTPLHLSREEHQASHRIWPTVYRQGRFVTLDWKNL
ncbi:MAG: ABC transporter substrate-binding protein [Magnetococcales bacterium]|nr:ABC transporter substrate-binding protein [Magnetococcales bacterium]